MAKLAKIKTTETTASVEDFLNKIADETKRKDAFTIMKLMEKVTKEKAKMWGSAIIGYGNLIYKSPTTDRQVEWFKVGFSPRKANLTIYLMNLSAHTDALKKLGKHKVGGGCLYLNKLADVDLKVLEGMVKEAAKANTGK